MNTRAPALEQCQPKLILQPSNTPTDGRRVEAKGVRRPGKTTGAGQSHKIRKITDFHVPRACIIFGPAVPPVGEDTLRLGISTHVRGADSVLPGRNLAGVERLRETAEQTPPPTRRASACVYRSSGKQRANLPPHDLTEVRRIVVRFDPPTFVLPLQSDGSFPGQLVRKMSCDPVFLCPVFPTRQISQCFTNPFPHTRDSCALSWVPWT